jgi:aryl-alcohol dehydrogenase-like predicted oxidoreductase
VRSSPGVTTALVGMRRRAHVEENLALAALPPATDEAYVRLFTEGGRRVAVSFADDFLRRRGDDARRV